MEFIYPDYLRPKKGLTQLTQQKIIGFNLIRETMEDIYTKVQPEINFCNFDFTNQNNINIANNIKTLITKPTGHEDICCLSVCLYGTYTEKDCGINCTNSEKKEAYYSDWDFNSNPIDIDNNDFRKIERYPLYFNVSRILNVDRKIMIQNENDDEYVEKKLEIHFIHKPTQINYWHFEFRVFIDKQEISKPILSSNKRLDKGIKTFMKTELLACIDWQKDSVKFKL